MGEPKTKRPRHSDLQELLGELWSHWEAYMASTEQADPETTPDVDELSEILDRVNKSGVNITPLKPPMGDDDTVVAFYVEAWQEPSSLMSVLLSMSAHALADDAIATYLAEKDATNTLDDEENHPLPPSPTAVHKLVSQALEWFPSNPSTWSMLANWIRMTQTKDNPLEIAKLYCYAARHASLIRQACLKALEKCSDDDDNDDSGSDSGKVSLPVMIEGLLLNQIVDVEYLGDDGDSPGDSGDGDDSKEKHGSNAVGWSVSAVEGTARFMAAMQLSMAGHHQEAAKQLQYFDCTHRLHPNVWDKTKLINSTDEFTSITKEPALFKDSVLPPDVLQHLRSVFHPKAPYWVESSYSERGYYSFFIDRLQKEDQPKDLIQDVIESYLLPLVEKKLSSDSEPIVGYEWWVHTRPLAANLGHNLHFDTDEALLKSQKKVAHPVVSSVLYLDGTVGKAGPTIVLNQTSAENAKNADAVWRNDPKPNSYLLFPGNMLHGVLPCSASQPSEDAMSTESAVMDENWTPDTDKYLKESTDEKIDAITGQGSHRLSFMVGFWTRCVPDDIAEPTELYIPCGPMPPNSHSWAEHVRKGYPRPAFFHDNNRLECNLTRVPMVKPAWESIGAQNDREEDNSAALEIPSALDHRFFVRNPPSCFRDSLFDE